MNRTRMQPLFRPWQIRAMKWSSLVAVMALGMACSAAVHLPGARYCPNDTLCAIVILGAYFVAIADTLLQCAIFESVAAAHPNAVLPRRPYLAMTAGVLAAWAIAVICAGVPADWNRFTWTSDVSLVNGVFLVIQLCISAAQSEHWMCNPLVMPARPHVD